MKIFANDQMFFTVAIRGCVIVVKRGVALTLREITGLKTGNVPTRMSNIIKDILTNFLDIDYANNQKNGVGLYDRNLKW